MTHKESWSQVTQLGFIAHPMYHQWFFTEDTCQRLHDVLPPNQLVTCLGAPVLGTYLALRGHQVQILDIDQYVLHTIGTLKLQHCTLRQVDLGQGLPTDIQSSPIVIIDPPWYEKYYQLFLYRAAHIVRLGGYIYAVAYPDNTRDSAKQEKLRLQSYAKNLGTPVMQNVSMDIRYQTPTFEQRVFGQARSWRSADLWVLQHQSPPLANVARPQIHESGYHSFNFPYQRITVRPVSKENKNLMPLVRHIGQQSSKGGTSERRLTNVLWTSAGELYTIENVEVVIALLQGLQDGLAQSTILASLAHVAPLAHIEKVYQALLDIIYPN